jgi:hypothetical protein
MHFAFLKSNLRLDGIAYPPRPKHGLLLQVPGHSYDRLDGPMP